MPKGPKVHFKTSNSPGERGRQQGGWRSGWEVVLNHFTATGLRQDFTDKHSAHVRAHTRNTFGYLYRAIYIDRTTL